MRVFTPESTMVRVLPLATVVSPLSETAPVPVVKAPAPAAMTKFFAAVRVRVVPSSERSESPIVAFAPVLVNLERKFVFSLS